MKFPVFAFVVSPLLGVSPLVLVDPLGWISFLYTLPISYASAALFGIPLFGWLRKMNWRGWHHAMAGGLLSAAPFTAAYFLVMLVGAYSNGLRPPWVDLVRAVLMFAWFGLFTGLVFWFFAMRRPQTAEA